MGIKPRDKSSHVVGSSSNGRKRKKSSTISDGGKLIISTDEAIRRVQLLRLKFKALDQKMQMIIIGGLALVALMNVTLLSGLSQDSGFSLYVRSEIEFEVTEIGDAEASSADSGKQTIEIVKDSLEHLQETLGGIGEEVDNESVLMKKASVSPVEVWPEGNTGSRGAALDSALTRIERQANRGWNVTSPKVLPLGQNGYVKRDLPVYKDGFNRIDITVGTRPKSGIAPVEQLQGNGYNMVLCLSFNTDHCFDPLRYDALGGSRKVNRIQNLRDVVWSKHKFCRTMSGSTRGLTDPDLLSFTFPCWVMPMDYDRMIKYSDENDIRMWIAKPRSLGAGMGIYVVSDRRQLAHEKSTSNVVQTYLENPHLIEKRGLGGDEGKFKWDMRSYVLVSSVTPLRAYVYHRGLIRISTSPYTKDCKGNITACLTNTSLNKKVEGAQLKDITWSFKKFKDYLAEKGETPWEAVFLRIQRAIGLTLLSSESELLKNFTPKGYRCENCYQLLGVDVIFDSKLEPKVVEINGEPNLKCTSNGKTHYDFTKRGMARDLVATVYNDKSQKHKVAQNLAMWAQRKTNLGEDHLRYILDTFREHSNRGGFSPVYPNPKLADVYGKYLRFLRDRESAKESAKPSADNLVHAGGRRYRLHQIITALQSPKALAELASTRPQQSEDDSSDHDSSSLAGELDSERLGAPTRRRRRKSQVVVNTATEDEF